MYATGVSMGLMISLVGIGTVIMQGAINIFGTDIIVAHTTARKISEIFMLLYQFSVRLQQPFQARTTVQAG